MIQIKFTVIFLPASELVFFFIDPDLDQLCDQNIALFLFLRISCDFTTISTSIVG